MDMASHADFGALAIALRRINHALDRHSRRQNALSGLTVPQAMVLAFLGQCAEPPSIKELSQAMAMSQATTTDITQRLQGKGLLNRDKDPSDGRRTTLRLTPAGTAALESAAELLPTQLVRGLQGLSPSRQNRLLRGVLDLAALLSETPTHDTG